MTIYTVINVIARDADTRRALGLAGNGFIQGSFASGESAKHFCNWLNENVANAEENEYFIYKSNLHQ